MFQVAFCTMKCRIQESKDMQSLARLARGPPDCLSSRFLMEGGVTWTLCFFLAVFL